MTYETLLVWSKIAGLLLFLSMFLGVLAWLCRPGAGRRLQAHAEIPFRCDDEKA
jgi:cbb3-type cytochrome oxidase subunit 3